jgi:hypothetical protein
MCQTKNGWARGHRHKIDLGGLHKVLFGVDVGLVDQSLFMGYIEGRE